MEEFLIKLGFTMLLSAAIYFGVQMFDHWIEYWAALLISSVVVFGGFLILDSDVIH